MSRAIIKELYWELDNEKKLHESNKLWNNVKEIEIVPRKLVEMIIEECKRNAVTNYKYGNYCAGDNLVHIREYAESLLKQFEEDDK